ncbi:uncharacterized protein [Littorina saxatilis]|uniref:uncharacterized protein n=1 Tax=Littorina saxatilis TaxID=31220 RepID=UPI0038B50B97
MDSLVPLHHNLHFRYHFPHRPPPHVRWRCCCLSQFALPVWLVILALTVIRTMGSSTSPPLQTPALVIPVRAFLLCDNSTFKECVAHAQTMTDEASAFSASQSFPAISLNVSVVQIPNDRPETLRTLASSVGMMVDEVDGGEGEGDVLMAVGSAGSVEMATVLARGLGKPLLGYVSEDSWKDSYKPLTTDEYLSANADPVSQGATLALLIGEYNMPHTYILIQDIFLGGGFLEGFRSPGENGHTESYLGKSTLFSDMSDEGIESMMEDVSSKGWKIIVLHCQPQLMLRVVRQAVEMNLFGTGYGWFLSEAAMTYDKAELRTLPEGLLGLRGFYRNQTRGLLRAAARTISCAYACMQECFRDISYPVPSSFSSSSSSSSSLLYNHSSSSSSPSSELSKRTSSPSLWSSSSDSLSSTSSPFLSLGVESIPFTEKFRVSCNTTTQYFTKCVRYSPSCQLQYWDSNTSFTSPSPPPPHISSSSNNGHSEHHPYPVPLPPPFNFSTTILQRGTAYNLLNLVVSGETERMWDSVGYITATGQTDLKTVMWPGHTIFSPSSEATKTYRVVTRPAKPFVNVEGPVTSADECYTNMPCLRLPNSSRDLLTEAIDDFTSLRRRRHVDYSVFCCKGISLEVLKKLSEDLNFQYVIYFVNDSNYGEFHNNSWTGMVGDVIGGSADLIVGSFSMTSERMRVISFTEPYFQNEFSLVTGEEGQWPSMWAFLSPFSAQVWTCIMLSSIVAGVATSSLEWFSPFGLNPRGRKRNKQYGLGSGLLMVWVLVTGHTINVKAPKSWPSKVIQNVWAGLAIFIMTSYTANLAAYLAGQSAVISVKSIYDSKLLEKRVSVIKSSSVEHFLEKINPDLHVKTRDSYVNSTVEGLRLLQSGQTDVYLDDYHLLEYEVSRIDKECTVQFVGKGFGSDGYAIGLRKNSWMKTALSNKILSYTESGFMQEVSEKYLKQPRCGYFLSGSAVQYGLEHTGGLFLILLSAVFVSILLLFLEHLAYKFFIPWCRSKPANSFWKTENLAFFSQRVHRVVRSERLYSQKQAAQEMIKIVKQRDFTRLIQKNELQKRKIPPQKRVKTKAEMFQEITANIVSYHRQMKEPDEDDQDEYTDDNDLDGDFVTYDVMNDPLGVLPQTPTSPICPTTPTTILEENHIGLNNLGYFPDVHHADRVIDVSNGRTDDGNVEDRRDDEGDDMFDVRNGVRVPSPSKRNSRSSNSSSVWSSPRRKQSVASSCGSNGGGGSSRERRDRTPSISVIGASASEPTSPEPRESWELPGVGGSQRGQFRSPQPRRVSDVSPRRLPGNRPMQNNARSRSQDYQNWDYFQKNLKLKDNRVKSTLRRHALSGYQSQVPADFLDECTVEALSKEDLLILWKKSELELQTKLNDVVGRNRRLALAIDYLTKQEAGELIGEEV